MHRYGKDKLTWKKGVGCSLIFLFVPHQLLTAVVMETGRPEPRRKGGRRCTGDRSSGGGKWVYGL